VPFFSQPPIHLVKDVILVDGRGIAEGATGRNGGIIHPQSWEMLPRMLLNGKDLQNSVELVQMEVAGRNLIRKLSDEFHIDCDLEQDVDACQGNSLPEKHKGC
jgi:glycine/D-amino acid oxidase-like deaminating enzyme